MRTKEPTTGKSQKRTRVSPPLLGTVILAVALCASQTARADNTQVRWDLISLDFTTSTISPGGNASAFHQDSSEINLTGSGTFRSNSGEPQDVTGGGHLTT